MKLTVVYNELTVEKIGEGIKEFIRYQAALPNGPDLGSDVVVAGLVRDPDLKRVLDVKGEIVIRIKGIPDALVGIDDDLMVPGPASEYTEGQKRIRQLAAAVGANHTAAPFNVD